MITTETEYEKAQAELRDLQDRLEKLQRDHPIGKKGFTKAGIRKLIARINEEPPFTRAAKRPARPPTSRWYGEPTDARRVLECSWAMIAQPLGPGDPWTFAAHATF